MVVAVVLKLAGATARLGHIPNAAGFDIYLRLALFLATHLLRLGSIVAVLADVVHMLVFGVGDALGDGVGEGVGNGRGVVGLYVGKVWILVRVGVDVSKDVGNGVGSGVDTALGTAQICLLS